MSKRSLYVACLTLAFFMASQALCAHHGSSNYDMSKTISVKGTVAQFAFINPHSAIRLDAKGEKGNAEPWLVEADSPTWPVPAGPETPSNPVIRSRLLGIP